MSNYTAEQMLFLGFSQVRDVTCVLAVHSGGREGTSNSHGKCLMGSHGVSWILWEALNENSLFSATLTPRLHRLSRTVSTELEARIPVTSVRWCLMWPGEEGGSHGVSISRVLLEPFSEISRRLLHNPSGDLNECCSSNDSLKKKNLTVWLPFCCRIGRAQQWFIVWAQ